jgi:hypothetical protein
MESTTVCLACGERGHGSRKCAVLASPLKDGFYSGGGGGHSHDDDEDEQLSKKVTPIVAPLPVMHDRTDRTDRTAYRIRI